MKLLGRILALLIAALLSVFAVQRFIRRLYSGWGERYVEIGLDLSDDRE